MAAPFTGGGSLLVATAASASLSIGGGVKGYLSDKDMQKETAKILDDLSNCMVEIQYEEDELQSVLQKTGILLESFQESGIQERIIEIAEKIEHKVDDGHSFENACAAAKPILDCCKNVAVFKSVLMSQGSTRLVRSVMTVQFLLRKTNTFIGYIPGVALSRSSETLKYGAIPMTSVEAMLRAGPMSIKTALTKDPVKTVLTNRIANNARDIGNNLVARVKDSKIFGSVKKSTDTLTKTAGTVSKVGVGISVLGIAYDTYSLVNAYKDKQKQHPKSKDIRDKADEGRALIRQVEDTYRDLTILHNELLSLFDNSESASDEINNDEVGNVAIEEDGGIGLGSDDVDNIRAYLEFSQIVLG